MDQQIIGSTNNWAKNLIRLLLASWAILPALCSLALACKISSQVLPGSLARGLELEKRTKKRRKMRCTLFLVLLYHFSNSFAFLLSLLLHTEPSELVSLLPIPSSWQISQCSASTSPSYICLTSALEVANQLKFSLSILNF